MHAPETRLATVRGLAWQYLHAAWAPRLGEGGWGRLVSACGAPDPARLDPLAAYPLGPFEQSLLFLEQRLGRGDGAVVCEAGRGIVGAWAGTYRHLARQLRGDPARMLQVMCAEVLPWLHDAPDAARVVDAGEVGAVVELRPGLPAAFQEGLLEGAVEAAGVRGARVAREGARLAVSWELAAAQAARPSRLDLLARAVRLPYLGAALVPVLVGAALAWQDGFLRLDYLALTALGVALFSLASSAANDYFDRRADAANPTPTPFAGGSRVLPRGLLGPRAVAALAAGLYAAGVAVGLHLAFHLQGAHGAGLREVLALGVLGFLVGLLYTAPPVALARRGLGELAVGLGFGPLLVAGTYLVQRAAAGAGAAVSAEAVLYSLPLGALVAAVLYINEFPDRPWDAQAGKRTLVVRLSPRAAVAGYGALLALAYASIAALAVLTGAWFALAALATMPLAWKAWRILRRSHGQPYQLVPASAATVVLHVATGLLLSGGIALARVLGRA